MLSSKFLDHITACRQNSINGYRENQVKRTQSLDDNSWLGRVLRLEFLLLFIYLFWMLWWENLEEPNRSSLQCLSIAASSSGKNWLFWKKWRFSEFGNLGVGDLPDVPTDRTLSKPSFAWKCIATINEDGVEKQTDWKDGDIRQGIDSSPIP